MVLMVVRLGGVKDKWEVASFTKLNGECSANRDTALLAYLNNLFRPLYFDQRSRPPIKNIYIHLKSSHLLMSPS